VLLLDQVSYTLIVTSLYEASYDPKMTQLNPAYVRDGILLTCGMYFRGRILSPREDICGN